MSIDDQQAAAKCLHIIGSILCTQNQHEEGRLKLEEAIFEFSSIGNQLGAAEYLSEDLAKQGRSDDARLKLERARSVFVGLGVYSKRLLHAICDWKISRRSGIGECYRYGCQDAHFHPSTPLEQF